MPDRDEAFGYDAAEHTSDELATRTDLVRLVQDGTRAGLGHAQHRQWHQASRVLYRAALRAQRLAERNHR